MRARGNAVQYVAYVCCCPRMSNIPVSLTGLHLQGLTYTPSAGVIHHLCSAPRHSSPRSQAEAERQSKIREEVKHELRMFYCQVSSAALHCAVLCCASDVHRRALGSLVSCVAHAASAVSYPALPHAWLPPSPAPLPLSQVCHKQYPAAHEMEERAPSTFCNILNPDFVPPSSPARCATSSTRRPTRWRSTCPRTTTTTASGWLRHGPCWRSAREAEGILVLVAATCRGGACHAGEVRVRRGPEAAWLCTLFYGACTCWPDAQATTSFPKCMSLGSPLPIATRSKKERSKKERKRQEREMARMAAQ